MTILILMSIPTLAVLGIGVCIYCVHVVSGARRYL